MKQLKQSIRDASDERVVEGVLEWAARESRNARQIARAYRAEAKRRGLLE